jgi:hypothetical protein
LDKQIYDEQLAKILADDEEVLLWLLT